MNFLSRSKQIEIIAALCDSLGIRATARITGADRGTVADFALKVGRGCAVLHDGMMSGLRVSRLELDELWSYVGRKQKRVKPNQQDAMVAGDQYTFVGLASAARAIISYRTGDESLRSTPAMALGIAERVWTIGDLVDAALATQPITPKTARPIGGNAS